MNNLVITIDGPAASGKSSVSRELARRLQYKWVSTGAFYRGLAYVAMREGVPSTEIKRLVELTRSGQWSVVMDEDLTRVHYGSQDVTNEILAEENGTRASLISQIPEVRQALLQNQRDCATGVGLVAEGRDCGTVVFPRAMLKIYLTASQEERAQRRALEQGLSVEQTQVRQTERDRQDQSRSAAPLAIPENAQVVNSSGLVLSEVVNRIEKWAREAIPQSVKSF